MDQIGVAIAGAKDGRLAVRVDAETSAGVYRKILRGLNDTLDAVIGPLNMAAEYVDRISKGDIPPRITDEYRGDFNEIKHNLNTCIDAIQRLVADATALSQPRPSRASCRRAPTRPGTRATSGRPSRGSTTRWTPSSARSTWRPSTSIGSARATSRRITDEYRGDFNEIKNNLNACIDAIQRLVADADALARTAATAG